MQVKQERELNKWNRNDMETNKMPTIRQMRLSGCQQNFFQKEQTEVESTYVLELYYRFRYRKIVCRKDQEVEINFY